MQRGLYICRNGNEVNPLWRFLYARTTYGVGSPGENEESEGVWGNRKKIRHFYVGECKDELCKEA